jgi:hypothetical protein
VLASSWHFFRPSSGGKNEVEEKKAFLRTALSPMVEGTRVMIAMEKNDPEHCRNVTYEALKKTPNETIGGLFRFLGVSDAEDIVADCLEKTSFAAQSGRQPGVTQNGSFFRSGVVGGWEATLNQEMNAIVVRELGWSFPHFGWQP